MAVCIEDRIHVIEAINLYASGQIRSDKLDELLDVGLTSSDRGMGECASWLWCLYDDFKDAPMYPDPLVLLRMKRIIAFLASGLEYTKPSLNVFWFFARKKSKTKPYWPFATQREWRDHRHLATLFRPDTDALVAVHARSTFKG